MIVKIKAITLGIFLIGFLASGLAVQPKILEVEDQFGNTFETSESRADASWATHYPDQELVISDDNEMNLCVTEVESDESDTVLFRKQGLVGDGTPWVGGKNCFTWDLSREQYGDSIRFGIQATNNDDIGFDSGNVDYTLQVEYDNLKLADEDQSEGTIQNYETVSISSSELEELRSDSEELSNIEEDLDAKNETIEELRVDLDEKDSEINELNQDIDQKESTIQDLNNEIDSKDSKINEMNSTITELRSKVEELEGGLLNSLGSLF